MQQKYRTINEYIAWQEEPRHEHLQLIRQIIKTTVPEAIETISYQMPAFKYHGMLCYFAVFKGHYSLFVDPEIRSGFDRELTSFKTTKSAIHFPLDKPLPTGLIENIVRFAAMTNLEKAQKKRSKPKK
jgi:uncharacterized protein YdhG (YjbR/CyaY superfamily)